MANRHTQKEGGTIKNQILEFVRAHPECTTHDIRASLGQDLARLGMNLSRLSNAGLVTLERTKGQRLGRWSAVDEELTPERDKPIQIVRKEWDPVHVRRDPLIAALFGQPT